MDWTIVATTGDGLVELGPYVPSICDQGVVAFTARRTDGSSVVVLGDEVLEIAAESHPDVNRGGEIAVYTAEGVRCGDDLVAHHHGPLGPTINNHGQVAWRSNAGIHLDGVEIAGARFASFDGLPVVNDEGAVAFRATLHDGRAGIYVDDHTVIEAPELGRFPSLNHRGTVVFVSPGGVHRWRDDRIELVHEGWTYRGALVDDDDRVVFYATPPGGTLGVYARGERVLGLGDPFDGSPIVDFALNPVSINARGQLAVRLALADGRQLIVRS